MTAPEGDRFKQAQMTAVATSYGEQIAAIRATQGIGARLHDRLTPKGRRIRRLTTDLQTHSDEVSRQIDFFRNMHRDEIVTGFHYGVQKRLRDSIADPTLYEAFEMHEALTPDEQFIAFHRTLQTKEPQSYVDHALAVITAAKLALISGDTVTIPLSAREREGGVYNPPQIRAEPEVKRNILYAYELFGIPVENLRSQPSEKLFGEHSTKKFTIAVRLNHNQDEVYSEDSTSIPYVELTIKKVRPRPKHGYSSPPITLYDHYF